MTLRPGDAAPQFQLPDTDGLPHSLDRSPATLLFFTCNHCPYALAWHDRIVQVFEDYLEKGVHVVAINPNDGERYPADSYAAMQERVRRENWRFPYLHDATQKTAKAFGATVTPEVFILDADGVVQYHGAPDADHGDPSLEAEWIRDALDEVLEREEVTRPETEPVGCSIKWRE